MGEFAAFLEYKGIPVLSLDNYRNTNTKKPILVKGEENYTNNLWGQYIRFICLQQYQPSSGDLFVILPPNAMIFYPEFSQHVWGDDIRNYSQNTV